MLKLKNKEKIRPEINFEDLKVGDIALFKCGEDYFIGMKVCTIDNNYELLDLSDEIGECLNSNYYSIVKVFDDIEIEV